MPKQVKKEGRGIYPTYTWGKLDHDPIIDILRARSRKLGYSNMKIQGISRVSVSTLSSWWKEKTKRPQFSTIAAVAGALDGSVTISWAGETAVPIKAFEPTSFARKPQGRTLRVVGGRP